MYNEVINLLTITETLDPIGDLVETITKKEVFAKVKNVWHKETYEALAVGLKLEYKFVLADYYDYDGQEDIEFEDVRYKVVRVDRKDSNELEIVVTR